MKKKIAITFPHLHDFGGGEIFCEYVANYLNKYYEVHLYYYNYKNINKKLRINKNIILNPVQSNNFILNIFCKNFISIAQLYLIFYLRKFKFFFIFSAAGEFFSNNKTYQYIHHPFFSLNPTHYLSLGLKKREVLKIFLRFLLSILARTLIAFNKKKFSKNITFVNSEWIKNRYYDIYHNKNINLIYPTFKTPKFYNQSFKNFEKRNNDFVILGRVSRDKNTIEGINFFLKLKHNNPDLKIGKLHVIGPIQKNENYLINKFKFLYRDHCKFYGYVTIKKRDSILKKSKYGIHFFKGEHFGRSILEMQKLGLIVFAHDSGGSREILIDYRQKYSSFFELSNNINNVMMNKHVRKILITKIKNNFSNKFTDLEFRNKLKKYLINDK